MPESSTKISGEYFLRDDQSSIFVANRIETKIGEKVHNHDISEGFGKYLISKVLNRNWSKYDQDIHCPGSYIIWKNDNSLPTEKIHFYNDDGEGIKSGTADTIDDLQLKHGSKRKCQPEN